VAQGAAAGPDGSFPGGEQNPDRFPDATAARLSDMVPGKGFAGGPVGVEHVGLGSVTTCRPSGAVDLHYPFALLQQIGGQHRPEAAGALDGSATTFRIGGPSSDPGEHLAVAERVGGQRGISHLSAGAIQEPESVGVLVGVDPNDEVDPSGETHAIPP